MNNKRLRNKFIKLASFSLVFMLVFLFASVNLFATYRTNHLFESMLIRMIENGGKLPMDNDPDSEESIDKYFDSGFISKSFAVSVSPTGKMTLESANLPNGLELAKLERLDLITSKNQKRGRLGPYRYQVGEFEGETIIAFGDFEQEELIMTLYLESSLCISVVAMLILLVLLSYFSGKVVRPLVENAERQKSFISNAGHELKTPLAIISANAQMLELESGEDNVWIANIQNQTIRMANLVENLLRLSSMGGENIASIFEAFSLSSLIEEIAESFKVVANKKNCTIITNVETELFLEGDEKTIRELIMILCDNAVKYAPSNSTINVRLSKFKGKSIFSIENQLENGNTPDTTKLFDRFYRADSSRARESGGYGLGLSIAKSVVSLHQGTIKADILKGDKSSIVFTVSL